MKRAELMGLTGAVLAVALVLSGAVVFADDDQPVRGKRGQGNAETGDRGFKGGGDRKGPGPGPGGAGPYMQALKELNLTEEQKSQIKAIMEEQREKHEAGMNAHRDEIEAIDKQIRELTQKKVQLLGVDPAASLEKVKGVLTAEQKTQLEEKMSQMRERGFGGGPGAEGGKNRKEFKGDDGGDAPKRRGKKSDSGEKSE